MTIAGLALLYFLIGVLYLLAYLIGMRPPEKQTLLGLTVLFWPIMIVVELVFALGKQFGKATFILRNRIDKVI